jgi:hypothetical protein
MCCYTTNQVQSLLFFHLAIVIAIHSPEVSQEGDHNGLILCPERNSLSLAIHGEEGDSSQGVATNADGGDRIGGGGGGGRGEGKFLVGFFLVDDAGQRRRRAAASRGAKTRVTADAAGATQAAAMASGWCGDEVEEVDVEA